MALQLTDKQVQDGWQVVKFAEIAKEVRVTTKNSLKDGLEYYVGLEHIDPQSLRIQRKGRIAEDNPSFTKRFFPGQILFGRRRAYLKKAALPLRGKPFAMALSGLVLKTGHHGTQPRIGTPSPRICGLF